MRKLKIALLSLGVVLGYGLGIAHIVRHVGHDRRAMHDCVHACADAHGYCGHHGREDARPRPRGGQPSAMR